MERIFTSEKNMIRDIPRVLLVVKYLLAIRIFVLVMLCCFYVTRILFAIMPNHIATDVKGWTIIINTPSREVIRCLTMHVAV